MSICQQLRINESLFEGYELPLTIRDALIFFSTENLGQNTPKHMNSLLTLIRENNEISDEELIKQSDVKWLIEQIQTQLTRGETNKNLKIQVMYNIFSLCLENYEIYKNTSIFIKAAQEKITHLLDYLKDCNHPAYQKAHELQDLHIRDNLVDRELIVHIRGEDMMG